MPSDRHEVFRHSIEKLLMGECPAGEEQALDHHLEDCADCQSFLAGSQRVIASLQAFSFEVDPALNGRVAAALRARAVPLEANPLRRPRLLAMFLLAAVLTMVGSLLELEFGTVLASLLDVGVGEARQALLGLWIIPSLFVLLLFPCLPLLAKARECGMERNV